MRPFAPGDFIVPIGPSPYKKGYIQKVVRFKTGNAYIIDWRTQDGRTVRNTIRGSNAFELDPYANLLKEFSSTAATPERMKGPSCTCGLHKVDPMRTVGHSSWCDLNLNNLGDL